LIQLILVLLNSRDACHRQAKKLLPQLRAAREVWATEAVLIEIGNALARSNRVTAAAFINSCYITSNIRVISVNRQLFLQTVDFYKKHRDKEWGLTDCISFIVMKEQGLTKALTADEHFKQAGFRALLKEKL